MSKSRTNALNANLALTRAVEALADAYDATSEAHMIIVTDDKENGVTDNSSVVRDLQGAVQTIRMALIGEQRDWARRYVVRVE